ncbi:MAG: NADH-quinone oxidoreductase subunit NuoG, partial [Actinomycetota bacterium]
MSSRMVSLTIDDKSVSVPAGTLIIRAAETLGIEIPRFCEHPLLSPVGACRQCYVEVEGQRKLLTSCTTPVAPDMVVRTQNASEQVRKAQVGNLEFLLLNHPLDCPICDRGGECPLQDQALAFGPGESRYVEAKRTYVKPIPLSPLVALDRERCVLCTRCTRFCNEISGDRFIELFERGAAEQVSIAPGEDFRSPFSGNTVQICPVGSLTSTTYRFAARPFDLQHADSVCQHCASGCSLRVDARAGTIVRHLARDNEDVNEAWLCDKGRYAYSFPDSEERMTTPLLREHGLEPASFQEIFARIVEWSTGKRVAFLTGGRLANEDAYALSRLARTAFRTNDLDHRRVAAPEAVEARAAAAPLQLSYRDVEHAKAILVVGLDAEQELPILHLRIRKAARRGAKVFVVHPRGTRLRDLAEHVLVRPEEQAATLARLFPDANDAPSEATTLGRAAAALREAGPDGVVIAGPRTLDGGSDAAVRAAALAAATGAKFALTPRRSNDTGALRAGVHPGLLPGGRRFAEASERAMVEDIWGALSDLRPGRDTAGILRAAAAREVDVLFLIGVDPLRDFPDAKLARHALENVPHKVVQDIAPGEYLRFSDAFLPAAAAVEREGHVTDWEGRALPMHPVRPPRGLARPDWEIFTALAEAAGAPFGFDGVDGLRAEMGRLLAPTPTSGASTAELPAAETTAPSPSGLTLFTYPLLVDEGRQSDGAERLKAALEDPAFVEMHLADAERAGVVEGARVRISTPAGAAEAPVRISEELAEGAVFVPFNQPGLAANELLSGSFTADVTIEPAEVGPAEAETGTPGESEPAAA